MPGGQKVQQTVESVLNLATNHVDISHGQLRFHIVRRCGGSGTYVTYISGPGAGQQQRLRTFAGGQCIGRVGSEHALVFGGGFGTRTVLAALYTPGFMNILTRLVYPSPEAVEALDPSQLLGGRLDLSNDLLLACVIGAVVIGVGLGIVVRQQATTGGTDIVGMLLQKFAGIKFSTGILLADGFVVLSGLAVIGFGIGTDEAAANGWMLTLYSLITIYISSRVIAYLLDGASYDKLLFIISDHHEELKRFIIDDLDRSATYIKSKGMYTDSLRDMIFLVVSRKEVRLVQHKIKEIDPKAFVVVTDAYETFGEGFKQFPEKNEIQAE